MASHPAHYSQGVTGGSFSPAELLLRGRGDPPRLSSQILFPLLLGEGPWGQVLKPELLPNTLLCLQQTCLGSRYRSGLPEAVAEATAGAGQGAERGPGVGPGPLARGACSKCPVRSLCPLACQPPAWLVRGRGSGGETLTGAPVLQTTAVRHL